LAGQLAPAVNGARCLLADSRFEVICNYKDDVREAVMIPARRH
jgi:hypothetical protein